MTDRSPQPRTFPRTFGRLLCAQALGLMLACSASHASLVNGGFEADAGDGSAAAWTDSNSVYGFSRCTVVTCGTGGGSFGAASGDAWILFGGSDAAQASVLEQTLTLGSNDRSIEFSLWAGRTTPAINTSLTLAVDGNVLWSLSQADVSAYAAGYDTVAVSLAGYNDGLQHTLSWTYTQAAGSDTVANWSLDDVALSAASPVPEPGSLSLISAALLALGLDVRRRRARKSRGA